MNREISANIIEPLVWDTIRKLLLEPAMLKEGYEQALEHEKTNHSRQMVLKEKLQKSIGRIELRLQNLTRAYTDPDIGMSKTEYVSQRKQIELELKTIGERMQEIEEALLTLPTPEEYATIERFAEEVRMRIDDENWEPTPENKRKILDLLNVQVWITKDNKFKVTGWFGESNSVSYKMRSHSARLVRKRAGMSPGFHLHRCRCLA